MLRSTARRSAVCALLSLYFGISYAQPNYVVKHIGYEQGLPHRNIVSLFQDARGVLWIGTEAGLCTFDGVDTERFFVADLSSNRITGIAEDLAQRLWVSTDRGLRVLDPSRGRAIPISSMNFPDSIREQDIIRLTQGPDSEILFSNGRFIYGYKAGNITKKFHISEVHLGGTAFPVFGYTRHDSTFYLMDHEGTLHMISDHRRLQYNFPVYDSVGQYYPNGLSAFMRSVVFPDKNKEPFITTGTDKGFVFDLKNGARSPYFRISTLHALQHRFPIWHSVCDYAWDKYSGLGPSVARDLRLNLAEHIPNGDWILGTNYGVFLVQEKQHWYRHIKASGGYSVRGITQDSHGNLLVGTYDGLMVIDSSMQTVRMHPKLAMLWDFAFRSRDTIWACREGFEGLQILVRTRRGDFKSFFPPKNNLPAFIKSFAKCPGGLWTATYAHQLFYIRHKDGLISTCNREVHYRDYAGFVKSLIYSPQTGLWVAGEDGLQHYILDPISEQIIENRTSHLPLWLQRIKINALLQTEGRYLWIGTAENGIIQYDIALNQLWQWTQDNGLSDNAVYGVLSSHSDSVVWVATRNGLSRLDRASTTFHNYYSKDGLEQNEFNTGARYRATDGTLYFGGLNGVSFFHPRQVPDSDDRKRPFVHIALYNSKKHERKILFPENLEEVSVQPEEQYIEIDFRVFDPFNTRDITFTYNLEGISKSQQTAGAHQKLVYASLPPGTYTLNVQSQTADGHLSKTYRMYFNILPKWYQTTWFKALAALFISGGLYIAYRIRIRYLHKDFELRKQVSEDLHDELGSRLYALKVMASKISNTQITETERTQLSHQFETSGAEALQTVRNFIWAFDPKQDRADELFERMDDFAENFLAPLIHSVRIYQDDIPKGIKVTPRFKHHLLNIYQELLTNIVKHTQAEVVEIFLSCRNKKMIIEIQNRHKGFKKKTQPSESFSIGRKNIDKRIKTIGASIIWSEPESGLQIVKLQVPTI